MPNTLCKLINYLHYAVKILYVIIKTMERYSTNNFISGFLVMSTRSNTTALLSVKRHVSPIPYGWENLERFIKKQEK